MFESVTERMAPAPRKRTVVLEAEATNRSATVYLGGRSFDISSDIDCDLTHENYDFALFGAAAIALRNNWDIETNLPVTAGAVEAVKRASYILDMWCVRRCYPVRFEFTNVVSPPEARHTEGLVCLSGGVDSTWAAIEKAKTSEVSYGVLIAGADYPSRSHPGFIDLFNRVQRISQRIGINAISTETTIRTFKLYWPVSHVFVLAMVLAFHASRFGRGYIAADFTLEQEYGYHPWGNSRPLVEALGGTGFPIRQAGQTIGRTAKLARIACEDPEFLKDISVCYTDKESGGNCGVCKKCILTKLNLAASNASYEQYFTSNPPLIDQFRRLSLPNTQAGLRRHMVFLKDIQESMPEIALRDVLDERLATLRNRVTPLGKV